jgi:hypothetical protein
VTDDGSPNTELYASFMSEAKIRLVAVHRIIQSLRPSANPPYEAFVDAESAILQLRFLCELVALASLAAHSGVGLNSSLLKGYHAGNIFRDLTRLNVHCFPKSVNPFAIGPELRLTVRQNSLDKSGLESIYNGCGDLLHRGGLKKALGGQVRNYDMSTVNRWAKQINDLLQYHTIAILDHGYILAITMNSKNDGAVEVVAMRMMEKP